MLTEQEKRVLELLVRGGNSTEMAAELEIPPNTVRTNVQSILEKLQVHSRLEAVAFAVRGGLLPDPRRCRRPLRRLSPSRFSGPRMFPDTSVDSFTGKAGQD